MTARLAILLALLLGGFGVVFALPRNPAIKPSALRMATWDFKNNDDIKLPNGLALWEWEAAPPKEATKDEKKALAEDTLFRKRDYYRPKTVTAPNGQFFRGLEEMQVSLIYSGQDMGNSIHRLERCLQAQGFSIEEKSTVTDKIKLWDGKPMPATRLLYSIHDQQGNKFTNITYYFFVGHETICSGHWTRTGIDIWDRITRGLDQEWAYLSVSTMLDSHPVFPQGRKTVAEGEKPPDEQIQYSVPLTKEEADTSLQRFIGDLVMELANRDQLKEHQRGK